MCGSASGGSAAADYGSRLVDVASNAPCSLDVLSPEGRKQNSPGRLRYATARPQPSLGSA
jgi:hypothetical protein